MRKIITSYIYPPIPSRDFDYQASFADYDIGDPLGYGRTAEIAIADLMQEIEANDPEEYEAQINAVREETA